MMKRLTGLDIPATGIAYGFDRTVEAADQLGLIPSSVTTTILVSVFSPEYFTKSLDLTRTLRQAGIPTEIYPDDTTKLPKQLKYADKKGIPYVAILGEEEASNNTITLKDLRTGSQKTVPLDSLPSLLNQS